MTIAYPYATITIRDYGMAVTNVFRLVYFTFAVAVNLDFTFMAFAYIHDTCAAIGTMRGVISERRY